MGDEVIASHMGRGLIKAWQQAVDHYKRLELQLNDAYNREKDARKALAAWLAPIDTKPGEKFAIWNQDQHGNQCLFELTIPPEGVMPTIAVRHRK